MMTRTLSFVFVLALAGCGGGLGGGLFGGGGGGGLFGRDDPEPVDLGPAAVEAPGGEMAAGAPSNPAGDGTFRGLTVASLGDATRPGLWIETPLVTEEGPGRVIAPDGTVASVTLIPSGGERGSGSRLSLQAMQALGLPLTDLPTVTVISDA